MSEACDRCDHLAADRGALAIHVLSEHSPGLRAFVEEQRTPKLPPASGEGDER